MVLTWLIALAAVLYVSALAVIWRFQERLLFQPAVLDPTQLLALEPDVHESRVQVPGAELSVLELRLPHPKGVVFFLHGNGGSLQSWFVNTGVYRQANFDLVMMDYRGYGKSSGHIESEAQLHADVRAVWAQVAPRYVGRRVVLYGRSLGTDLAAELAVELGGAAVPSPTQGLASGPVPDLTILVSPYLSMVAIARQQYPWVPSLLLRYPLRTDRALARIRSPVLLIHGDRDALIPLAHSQALQAASANARLVVVAGAGHGDLQEFDAYLQTVRAALAALPAS